MAINKEIFSVGRANCWSDFGSLFMLPFQMAFWARFGTDIGANLQTQEIILNCHVMFLMKKDATSCYEAWNGIETAPQNADEVSDRVLH